MPAQHQNETRTVHSLETTVPHTFPIINDVEGRQIFRCHVGTLSSLTPDNEFSVLNSLAFPVGEFWGARAGRAIRLEVKERSWTLWYLLYPFSDVFAGGTGGEKNSSLRRTKNHFKTHYHHSVALFSRLVQAVGNNMVFSESLSSWRVHFYISLFEQRPQG